MGRLLQRTHRALTLFGFDPVRTVRTIGALPGYVRDYRRLKSQQQVSNIGFPLGRLYPCLDDRSGESGTASGVYFKQDVLVARKIFADNPRRHVDIGSRIDGFVAHVASFRTLEVFDVRKMPHAVPNVSFRQVDLMAPLAPDLVDYSDSLSCLHALEHFGLGRYGEPIRFDGYLAGLQNMHRILTRGGKFYLSVPVGSQHIEFNAQRVFSLRYLLTLLEGEYEIVSFSFVDERGDLHEDVPWRGADAQAGLYSRGGCGIFEMVKR
jgi:hypothetical protein